MSIETTPAFEGTEQQKAIAAEVFRVMVSQGTFFAQSAPIRQTLTNLADFLARQQQRDADEMAREIDAALLVNEQVFRRESHDDEIVFITSRQGSPFEREEDQSHTFRERLYQPENPLPIDDISVVVSTSRPTLTTVEPVFISDYWQEQAGLSPLRQGIAADQDYAIDGSEDVDDVDDMAPRKATWDETETPAGIADTYATVTPESPAEETPAPPETPVSPFITGAPEDQRATEPIPESPEPAEEFRPTVPPAPEFSDEEIADIVREAIQIDQEPAEPAEPVAAKVEAEPDAGVPTAATAPEAPQVQPESLLFELADDISVDLSQPVDELIAMHGQLFQDMLLNRLDQDPLRRIVRFGTMLYPESALANLSKNDLRRIREDITEAGEPLLDTAIIADLYHQYQSDESFRFSLNYRLSREKDFEFVGVAGANLWSVRGLPSIGTKRVKAGEMAQLTSYLVEGFDDSLAAQSAEEIQTTGSVTHFLTFFEWVYGVLSLDAALSEVLPQPLLPDQRSAVLRFDVPQHFESYLVEVRYPTANRGGWLQGLEDFFQAHLIAGARITLEATEEPSVFNITYDELSGGDTDRILTFDDRKNKFAFSDMDYFAAVDTELLLNQQRFGKLKNLKAMPTNERRKSDVVLEHVFEVFGEPVGTRNEPEYQVDIDSLYAAYNVLRPASRSFLESLLETHPDVEADASTPGLYNYRPEVEQEDEEEPEIDIEKDKYDDLAEQWGYGDDE